MMEGTGNGNPYRLAAGGQDASRDEAEDNTEMEINF
jgi:hypothetical protein